MKTVIEIYAGKDKHTDKPVTITTWQSIYKLERNSSKDMDVL